MGHPLYGNKEYVKGLLEAYGIVLKGLKLDKSVEGSWRYSLIYETKKEVAAFGEGLDKRTKSKADLLEEVLEEHFADFGIDVEPQKVHNFEIRGNYHWRVEAFVYFAPKDK